MLIIFDANIYQIVKITITILEKIIVEVCTYF